MTQMSHVRPQSVRLLLEEPNFSQCVLSVSPAGMSPSPSTSSLNSSDSEMPTPSIGGDWHIKHLCEENLEAVRQICNDSFPLSYPLSWFQEVVATPRRYISYGLFRNDILTSLLVAEIKLLSECDLEDQDLELRLLNYKEPQAYVVYILSLAVAREHRRRGIATILLKYLLKNYVINKDPLPRLVYLHVLHSNTAAISFYRKNNFRYHKLLSNYYQIKEEYHDGCTMVLNINHERRSSWSLVKEFCNLLGAIFCAPLRLLLRLKPPIRLATKF